MSLSAGILIATLAAFPTTVSAFDTAPHFDITEDVLASEGFSPTAIHTVQAANFLVDFYEFMGKIPQWPLDSYCQGYASSLLKIGDAQHFDDLYPPTDVAHKWDAMLDATKSTVADKMKKTDSFGLLVLLGMSLHNVQDFYAHSIWRRAPPTALRSASDRWPSTATTPPGSPWTDRTGSLCTCTHACAAINGPTATGTAIRSPSTRIGPDGRTTPMPTSAPISRPGNG